MRVFIISSILIIFSCICNARNTNEPMLILTPKNIPSDISKNEKLKILILSCPNFKTTLNKKNLHADIEEEVSDGIYRIRMFEYGKGENTINSVAWLILDTKNNTLKDITYDPEMPIVLNYDKRIYMDFVENFLKKKELIFPTNESIASSFKNISTFQFPFEYDYEFIINLPKTTTPSKTIIPFIATCVDDKTDLFNCRVAKLPSINNYHLLLIFANDQKGEGRFFLCALDSKYNLTDKLLIYTAKDIQWKDKIENCYIHYHIMGSNKITLKEIVTVPEKNVLYKKSSYSFINGKFKVSK